MFQQFQEANKSVRDFQTLNKYLFTPDVSTEVTKANKKHWRHETLKHLRTDTMSDIVQQLYIVDNVLVVPYTARDKDWSYVA